MPFRIPLKPLEINHLATIADFQFGAGTGKFLSTLNLKAEHSPKTKRMKFIYYNDERIFSYRVNDGYLIPSIYGGILIYSEGFGLTVIANNDAETFVKQGKTLFAKFVADAMDSISSQDEVFVINEKKEFIAVGTALLPGSLMKTIKKGSAVNIRKGIENS